MTSPEKLHLPEYRKIILPNGMTVLLMEQHKLPLMSFEAILRSGSTADAPGAEGTASVTASLLRHGTRTHTADQYSQALDFIGGLFHAGAATDYTSISAEFMKKDLATGLDLLAEPLLEPVFPDEEVTKVLRQRVDGIRAAKDQAQHVIAAYFNAYLFREHPYGRAVGGDEESLTHIQRDAIAGYYRAQYDPADMILAAVGDFESSEMERLLREKFGGWLARKTAPAVNVDPAPSQKRRLLLVDKPDSTQTYFRIGNVGIARTEPGLCAPDARQYAFRRTFHFADQLGIADRIGAYLWGRLDFRYAALGGPLLHCQLYIQRNHGPRARCYGRGAEAIPPRWHIGAAACLREILLERAISAADGDLGSIGLADRAFGILRA